MIMNVSATTLEGVFLIEPRVFCDERGHFFESWNARDYAAAGISCAFVQDNFSRSHRGVLRGLHYQVENTQDKLVWTQDGEVYDVVVDLRADSPTFGRWEGFYLSAKNRRRLFVPKGFAHGFLVLSDSADFFYKCSDYYAPQHERAIRWDDPTLAIAWPLEDIGTPILSAKDAAAPLFSADCALTLQ